MQRNNVIILGDPDSAESLAARLLLLNYRGVPVRNATGALEVNARDPEPVRCVLVAGGHGLEDPAPVIGPIVRSLSSQDVEFIAVGTRPEPATIAALRDEGVRSALWEPYSDEELRFVMNRSHRSAALHRTRDSARVPSDLAARIRGPADAAPACVCTLSAFGAYVMTPRPARRGQTVELDIALPRGRARMKVEVVWHNAPGRERRPNAPLGMGVRFTRVDAAAHRDLHRYMTSQSLRFSL